MAVNNSRTRAETVKAPERYTEGQKLVKKCIRADEQKYMDKLTTEAEQAAREGNIREL